MNPAPKLVGGLGLIAIAGWIGARVTTPTARPLMAPPASSRLLEQVELAGCEAWQAPTTCLVRPGAELVLWLRAPGTPELRIRGAQAEPPSRVGGGWQLRVQAPDEARVTLEAQGPQSAEARWFDTRRPPHSAALDRARALRAAGTSSAARAALGEIPRDAPAWIRVQAEVERARMAARADDQARVIQHRKVAIEIAMQARLTSAVRDQNLALVHTLVFQEGDFRRARGAFEAARSALAPGGPALLGFSRAFLAQETQNTRAALDAFAETLRWAERLDQPRLVRATKLTQVLSLSELGRFQEALAVVDEVVDSSEAGDDPCFSTIARENRAWVGIRARQAGLTIGEPERDLAKAIERHETDCPRPDVLPNLWTNRALNAMLEGRIHAARDALNEARRLAPNPTLVLRLWQLDLQGRLALADGDPDAAGRAFDALHDLARRTVALDAAWRAELGRAYVALARAQTSRALEHFEAAEGHLDRLVAAAGLTQGRASLLSARRAATEAQVRLLIDLGRPREAAQALRRARARLLAGMHRDSRQENLDPEAEAAWRENVRTYREVRARMDEAAAEAWRAGSSPEIDAMRGALERHLDRAMQALATGEPTSPPALSRDALTLLFAELGQGWVGFALTPEHAAAHIGETGEDLLAPFADALRAAPRVRILAADRFVAMDLHALPFEGRPLSATRETTFAVDVPAPPPRGGGPLVVVVDPQGNLPGARDEGAFVARQRPDSTRLEGLAATAPAVRAAIASAGQLHYAGHGEHRGREGWDSALPLAEGALTVGDVLALPQVPAAVVLTGCETAKRAGHLAATLGLAQAFVLAGAEVVVAAARPVEDRHALELVRALYAGPSVDLVTDLHRAQRELRRIHPEADWAAFRAIVP